MSKNSPHLVEIVQGMSIISGLPTIPSWKIEDRPKNARVGTFGFNSETNSLEYWNGLVWLEAPMTQDQ